MKTPLIWVLSGIIVVLSWALVYYARDEWGLGEHRDNEEEIAAPSRVSSENGRTTLDIPKPTQEASGITTAPLQKAGYNSAPTVYGVVTDLTGLIELRTRYRAAKAESAVVRAQLQSSAAEYKRLNALHQDDRNVSARVVQSAHAQWEADKAKLSAAESLAANIHDNMRASWGEVLASWAKDANSKVFDGLIRRDEVIVQFAIPFDLKVSASAANLLVTPVAAQSGEREAQFVSPSPQVDASATGRTFFYRAPGRDLPIGTRVAGHFKSNAEAQEGVMVPVSAVVWHGGKAWAYIELDEQKFERREVATAHELDGGWFNTSSFRAGEEVVVSGAQLLLSEEFKYQIRNENED
ncbi:MAG TPA: hypothetical protein VFH21_06020 [Burkholderiales bacterium]|nr:hypothetical protein [Burkholderiales bacterium]